MTHNRTADYWISPNALRIERNAMSLPDYIQASCTSGAQILCYLKDIITYDAGHNYRRWTLQASPTAFNTHTPKYVYVAIPRDMTKTTAQVVFPSEKIDIYGKAERTTDGTTTEEQVGSTDYYYIFLQGILSSSGDNGTTLREWTQTIDTGTLSSDEALNANNDSEWYRYDSVMQIVTFLKDLTMKAGTIFRSLIANVITITNIGDINGKIQFGTTDGSPYVDGIAQSTGDSTESPNKIVTPKYMDDRALSKSHNDKTPYDLEMQNLKVNGTADIFGNVTIHDGASLSFGTFDTGLTGGRIQSNGDAELKSLVLRESLTVPKLVYNRVEVMAGNTWRGSGGGEIKTVTPDKDADNNDLTTGIATLQLEEGELGMIAVGDICQGIFHLQTGNDTLNTDEHNGNFHFAGFKTIYFEVTEILDTTNNSRFRYKLRAATDTAWTDATHPQPHMNFAVYGNRTRQDRQASAIDTTQYHLLLAGVTTWNYTSQNIQYIEGYLNGFTIDYITYDRQGNAIQSTKQLSGYGVAIGKMYQWGNIEQFDRANAITSQQLYFASTQSALTAPADITLTADRTSVQSLGTWQTDAILPTPAARYVWQQWLYGYADGTYAISQASIYAMDSSLLLVTPNRAIVPIAVSDFYDPDCPDDISFDLSAQIKSGTEPLAITNATAQFDSDSATLTYTTQLSADNKTVTYHLRLQGYVGTTVNGVTPEDSYITLSLTTAYGTGTTSVTLVQNREGEAGQDGASGKNGDDGKGISSITEYYALSTSKTEVTGTWGTTVPTMTATLRYLWNKETITYTDGSTTTTTPAVIGVYGDKGDSGNGINTVTLARMYTSTFAEPAINATGWITEGTEGYPTEQGLSSTNRYLWQRKQTTYTQSNDVTTEITLYAQYYGDETHVYLGEWVSGNIYMYANGVRHVVRAKDAAGSTTMTYYRMKRYTTAAGYVSETEPYADTAHWEKANYLKFTATDLLLAEEVITDKLTVTKLATTGSDSHIAIQDGMMEIFGQYVFPNIRIGIDADGCAILSFYDKNGARVYDLGPSGLSKISTTAATFTSDQFKAITVTGKTNAQIQAQIATIMKSDCTTYYKFSPKQTTTGSGTVYYYGSYSDNGTDIQPIDMGRYFLSNVLGLSDERKYLPANTGPSYYIADGWYAKPNYGTHYMVADDDSASTVGSTKRTYREYLYYFASGRNSKTGYIQWDEQDGIISNITLNGIS